MEQWQRDRLNGCLDDLSRSLSIEDTLMRLTIRSIFDINDTQLVQNGLINKTDAEKRQKIIEILKTRGSDAYWEFCHIIRQKTPQLFSMLHDVKGYDTATICTKCINGEDAFFECSYCKGLVNFLSNPKNGVFIDKPEDIIELFNATKEKMEAKDSECKHLTSEIGKLTKEHHELLVRHVNDLDSLNIKEKELKNKDKEYEALLVEKDNVVIQKEELQIKTDQLKNIITTLEKDINEYQIKLSEHQNDPIYENQQTIEENAITELKSKLLQANHKNEVLNEELMTAKREASRLKIKFETLETVFERQKRENDRVFEDLTNKLDDAQKQYGAASMENDVLKEQIKISKIEKEEAMKERDHLLAKVYEKDKIAKNASISSCTAERDLISLKKLHGIQVERVERIQREKDELVNQYKILLEERAGVQTKNTELLQERDKLVNKLINFDQNKSSNDLQKQIEECDKLQREMEIWKRKYYMLSEVQPGDTEIELQRTGRRFGVSFGLKRGPVFLGESKIVITAIDLSHEVAPLADIKIGDLVIKINDVNVQECDMNAVKQICEESDEKMKLVLRKKVRKTFQDKEVPVAGLNLEKFDDLGLKIGIFCLIRGKHANALGLQDLDEILKVNQSDTDSLSLADIRSKLSKIVKTKKRGDILVRRYEWQQEAGRFRSPSQLTDSTPNKSENSSISHSRQGSKASFNSSMSSISQDSPAFPQRYLNENSIDVDSESTRSVNARPSRETASLPNHSRQGSKISTNSSLSSMSRDSPALPQRPLHEYPSSDLGSNRSVNTRQSRETLHTKSQLRSFDHTVEQGEYSYVKSYQLNSNGEMVERNTAQDIPETEEIILEKKVYESFGFQMIGGNKTGIFVSAVDPWRPAEVCGMRKGWKILKINGFLLKNVAFCYAVEVLKRFSNDEKIKFVFEKTSISHFEEMLKRKPYDSFHVKALVPYKARGAGEISFNQGEILCVTNSHVIMEPGQPYKWKAIKEEMSGTYQISGLIPRQISPRSPTAIEEHTYEEIDEDASSIAHSMRGRTERRFEFYYQIMEPIGELLV